MTTQNRKEKARELVYKHNRKMEEIGYYRRGLDITPDHEKALSDYAQSHDCSSLGDAVTSLLIDYIEEKREKAPSEEAVKAAADRDRSKAKSTGFFLTDQQFNYIRHLPKLVDSKQRRSLANGVALMIEESKKIGLIPG